VIVPGSARAQHLAAGVYYQLETWRSDRVRGREAGTIKDELQIAASLRSSQYPTGTM